jgi:hypothetical protein
MVQGADRQARPLCQFAYLQGLKAHVNPSLRSLRGTAATSAWYGLT